MLVKSATIAPQVPVVPLLVCTNAAWPVLQMARDIGFFVCQLGTQIFSSRIPVDEFDAVVAEFGLLITQHEGVHPRVVDFVSKYLRAKPDSPPAEDTPFYRRQSDRFQIMASAILAHDSLAGALPEERRGPVLSSFRARAGSLMSWPPVKGW